MESRIKNILLRVSNKGVPHTLVEYHGIEFSVCYMHRNNKRFYRFWNYKTQEKLDDIEVDPGGSFNLQFVLDGLIQKHYSSVDTVS